MTFETVEHEKLVEAIDPEPKDERPKQIELDRLNDRSFIELAAIYPQAAIFQSFKEVEDTYVKTLGVPARGAFNIRSTISDLVSGGYLSQVDMHLFDQIRRIRNRAVHEEFGDITVDAVVNYKKLCDSFAEKLRATLIAKFKPDLDQEEN